MSKGMSKSRKDRIGICRVFSSLTIPLILSDGSLSDRKRVIGNMLSFVVDAMTQGRLSLSEVSKIVKRGGTNYYEYRTHEDKREWNECESYAGSEAVLYSPARVAKALKRELEAVLAVTVVGTMASVIRSSDAH